jgi:hypothetical protein
MPDFPSITLVFSRILYYDFKEQNVVRPAFFIDEQTTGGAECTQVEIYHGIP